MVATTINRFRSHYCLLIICFVYCRIISLLERGLNQRYLKEYNTLQGVTCQLKRTVERDPIHFIEVVLPFLILAFGLVISMTIAAVEIIKTKCEMFQGRMSKTRFMKNNQISRYVHK